MQARGRLLEDVCGRHIHLLARGSADLFYLLADGVLGFDGLSMQLASGLRGVGSTDVGAEEDWDLEFDESWFSVRMLSSVSNQTGAFYPPVSTHHPKQRMRGWLPPTQLPRFLSQRASRAPQKPVHFVVTSIANSECHSSTAFALLRASSLGLKTSDLSWAYCWTAIWADIEVYIGIIAANLSLSCMYYGWTKDVGREWLGRSNSESDNHYQGYQMSPFDGSKRVHSVQIRGRRTRKDSHTPSDESNAPLDGNGITREVQYRTLEICLATRQDLNVLRGFLLKDVSTFVHINFLTLSLLIFVILII